MQNLKNQMFSNLTTFDTMIKSLSSKEKVSLKKIYCRNALMLKSGVRLSKSPAQLFKLLKHLRQFDEANKRNENYFNHRTSFLKFKKVLLLMLSLFEFVTDKSPNSLDDKEWGLISSFMLHNSNAYLLKYKWFTSLKPSLTQAKWLQIQDDHLIDLMHQYNPLKFKAPALNINSNTISWSKISYELNKITVFAKDFKNNKKCKERWNNHLNPFVNKAEWSCEEDVKLLNESLIHPKKWSLIANSMYGRTQHSVKNRFYALIGAELKLSREKTREVLQGKNIQASIQKTLEILSQKNKLETNENLLKDEGFKEDLSDISSDQAIEVLFGTKENEQNDDFFLFDLNDIFP